LNKEDYKFFIEQRDYSSAVREELKAIKEEDVTPEIVKAIEEVMPPLLNNLSFKFTKGVS